jgi:hypothetical protein
MQRQDDDSDEQTTTAVPRIISRHRAAESEEDEEAPQDEEEEDDELREAHRAAVRERCPLSPWHDAHTPSLPIYAVPAMQLSGTRRTDLWSVQWCMPFQGILSGETASPSSS